jgi:hypothetical protein
MLCRLVVVYSSSLVKKADRDDTFRRMNMISLTLSKVLISTNRLRNTSFSMINYTRKIFVPQLA